MVVVVVAVAEVLGRSAEWAKAQMKTAEAKRRQKQAARSSQGLRWAPLLTVRRRRGRSISAPCSLSGMTGRNIALYDRSEEYY